MWYSLTQAKHTKKCNLSRTEASMKNCEVSKKRHSTSSQQPNPHYLLPKLLPLLLLQETFNKSMQPQNPVSFMETATVFADLKQQCWQHYVL